MRQRRVEPQENAMPSAPAERERNDPTGDAHHPAAGATHAMPDGSVTAGAHHDHRAHAHPPAAKRPTAAAVAGKDAEYTCPMHPQVRQMGPGNCPICGMALEPVLATAEQAKAPNCGT
jgi:Cu+-exporting ATPase